MNCLNQWLTKWQPLWFLLSALGTIAVVIFALLQDRIKPLIFSPKLELEQGPFYPDAEPVPILDKISNQILGVACYLQIRIKNNRATAEKVEVFIAKIEKEINGIFQEVKNFYPLNLKWRHLDVVFFERLSPGTGRDCTLGRIANPDNRESIGDYNPSLGLTPKQSAFRLELAVMPSTRSDLLTPGKYRLHLEIGASNAKPKRKTIILQFDGHWSDNPRDMAVAKVEA
jgi:hypothetical protein